MNQLITSPVIFADSFNAKVPGAYRQVTAEDVRDMTTSGLIGRYGYYINLDTETVRGILQYEQLRQNRQHRQEIRGTDGAMHCRRCGVVLARAHGRRGRPKAYCSACEPSRSRERHRKWRSRQTGKLTGIQAVYN